MFTIGTFSQLTGLPAKTLRYYHSQGLLVPAEVDEQSQFRLYSLDQIASAGQISAMRRAGFSVQQARLMLDDVDLVLSMLQQHQAMLVAQRQEQDDALSEVAAVLGHEPVVACRDVPAITFLSTCTSERDGEDYEPEAIRREVSEAAELLRQTAKHEGWPVAGPHWTTLLSTGGMAAAVEVNLPVWNDSEQASLPGSATLKRREAGRELYVRLPTPETLGTMTLALSHLLTAEVDGSAVDLRLLRQMNLGDQIEYAIGFSPDPPASMQDVRT